jgi:CRISPR/Cas system-associated endoribonuclease Cas2
MSKPQDEKIIENFISLLTKERIKRFNKLSRDSIIIYNLRTP